MSAFFFRPSSIRTAPGTAHTSHVGAGSTDNTPGSHQPTAIGRALAGRSETCPADAGRALLYLEQAPVLPVISAVRRPGGRAQRSFNVPSDQGSRQPSHIH